MIGLDTNILLRAITLDDPLYSSRAADFLKTCTNTQPGFINTVVLAECIWSLKRRYKAKPVEIVLVLRAMLDNDGLRVGHEDCVVNALSMEENHPGSFTDALIGELNREAGCATTVTFDTGAAKSDAVTLLEA